MGIIPKARRTRVVVDARLIANRKPGVARNLKLETPPEVKQAQENIAKAKPRRIGRCCGR